MTNKVTRDQGVRIDRVGRGEYRLENSVRLASEIEEVFAFFSRAEQLQGMTPRGMKLQIVTPLPIEMRKGARIDYRLRILGVPVKWRSVITRWNPPRGFTDEQEIGPYRYWRHHHLFEEDGLATVATDRVEYAVPGGALVHQLLVKRQLKQIFMFRRKQLIETFGAA